MNLDEEMKERKRRSEKKNYRKRKEGKSKVRGKMKEINVREGIER